ncbi:TetR/AcrR family transcriptional regulator C-terminal domain-containing protein [Streptomyces sp. NC-S4]
MTSCAPVTEASGQTSLGAGHPSLGPNSLDAAERALAALDPLGFDIEVMSAVDNTLQAFVRGCAIGELAQQEAVRRSGAGTGEWMDAHAPYLDKVVKAGRGFEPGRERFLDGWEAGLPARPLTIRQQQPGVRRGTLHRLAESGSQEATVSTILPWRWPCAARVCALPASGSG